MKTVKFPGVRITLLPPCLKGLNAVLGVFKESYSCACMCARAGSDCNKEDEMGTNLLGLLPLVGCIPGLWDF